MSSLALSVRGLSKSYGASKALVDVDFDVRAGEVHGLLGQNGSGKSTLVKIVTGVTAPDSGSMRLFGRTLESPVRNLAKHGIAVIHQDLGLAPAMTVLENLGVNAGYGTRPLGWIRGSSERSVYTRLMDRIGVELPFDALVSELSQAERAMLAVVRAMRVLEDHSTAHSGEHLFILDEPTAPLSDIDAAVVLSVMTRIAASGAGVVFISHRLNEVLSTCDRMTVLRAGRRVTTAPIGGMTRSEIVAQMLGERMEEFFPSPEPVVSERIVLSVDGLSGGAIREVSFAVREGEILGITGLAGMGQADVLSLVFGGRPRASGSVVTTHHDEDLRRPAQSMRAGVGLVPADRIGAGCWIDGSASENITLPVLRALSGPLGLRLGEEQAIARRRVTASGAIPDRAELPMNAFSGGNQQKIVIEKWRQLDPHVLLLDEPTQGVDPLAAKAILDSVVADAARGRGIVICSGDYEQLAAVCHRVIVFADGRIIAELEGEALTESAIILACEDGPTVHA